MTTYLITLACGITLPVEALGITPAIVAVSRTVADQIVGWRIA